MARKTIGGRGRPSRSPVHDREWADPLPRAADVLSVADPGWRAPDHHPSRSDCGTGSLFGRGRRAVTEIVSAPAERGFPMLCPSPLLRPAAHGRGCLLVLALAGTGKPVRSGVAVGVLGSGRPIRGIVRCVDRCSQPWTTGGWRGAAKAMTILVFAAKAVSWDVRGCRLHDGHGVCSTWSTPG